ncbi:RmlC-like cupins superfamily protein [Abeliophyllum distichum]|uniref:RmlC-like cupins superfamily protein n=1 Tax=Abeliophyllum distichum TaxID=126358 RepID=A0ABD1TKZ2_9LAMI
MTREIYGVKIQTNPPQSKLNDLGVSSWPTWSGGPSKIPWTFTAKETMYLLAGKVKVHCDGQDGFFEIGAGDLVEFPKGMKITWDVVEAVNKHYNLEKAGYGGWLLYTVALAGEVIFVKQLLDKDPLLYIARGGNVEILRKLLKDEYDVLAYRDAQGSTAFGRGLVEVNISFFS